MTEKVDFSQQIDHLIRLQEVDEQIYGLGAEKDAKPKHIQQLKDSVSEKQGGLKAAEEGLKELQLRHKEKEMDLQTKEGESKKLQAQLYQLKTNKEYTAMLHEIEVHRADNSILEDEILKLMDSIDAAMGKVGEEKKKLEEEVEKVGVEVQEVEAEIKKIEVDLGELEKKRNEITPTIDPKILKNYETILTGKNGLALAEVVNDSCSGCFMSLPSQVINEIKMKQSIVSCGGCWRMLYIKDEPA
ncbi:MAG: hypothetical protein HQ558_02690 [Candidatus Omnitrophica bacterium]|nr:hypothetical protein [Candidatus Omnitrophota bacterium]